MTLHGTDNYIPRKGDIGLTQIHGRVGALIRFGQFLNGDGFWNYQHAFVVLHDSWEYPVKIIEAEPGGAEINPLDRYQGYNVSYLRCPDELREAVASAAYQYEGRGYSAADYFSLAARRLHIPAPHLRAYIRSSGHMICSQLSDRIALDGGWHLFDDGRWEGDVTPGALYGLYRKQMEELNKRAP